MTIAYHAPAHPSLGYPSFVDPKPARVRAPSPSSFPRLDEDLVRPETREEIVRGHRMECMPAKESHAERHHTLDYVTHGVTAPGYVGATDLLTRAGKGSQFATDTCIRREGIDPATGQRYLEELAFEVVAEQSLRDITERAHDLATRGVRRIIAIFVKTNEVCEWSPSIGDWITLDPNGTLDDPTLIEPIPVRALLDGTAANRAVVRALCAKQEPAILEVKAEGVQECITTLCRALGIPLGSQRRTMMRSLDIAGLQALLITLGANHRWPQRHEWPPRMSPHP